MSKRSREFIDKIAEDIKEYRNLDEDNMMVVFALKYIKLLA